MAVSLEVAITHHPSRKDMLIEHLALLADGPVSICTDHVGGQRLGNYRAAWATAGYTTATHLAVLSDDMRPCPGFRQHLTAAIRVRPTSVICLFTMRRVLQEARAAGYSWIETENCAWGGAMVMPKDLWLQMAEWEREHVIDDADHQSDDTRIALWAAATRRRIYLTAPSLLQHVGAGASLVGHSNRRRVSSWVADETAINWDTPSLAGGRCSRGDPAWIA